MTRTQQTLGAPRGPLHALRARMRKTIAAEWILSLSLVVTVAGCGAAPIDESGALSCSGLCTSSLQSGSYVGPSDSLSYRAWATGSVYNFELRDLVSGNLLVTSSVSSESAGVVGFAGAQPFDGTVTPSPSDLTLFDGFATAHGNSVASLALLLDWRAIVDPTDPTQQAEYAALIQIVQTLQIYQSGSFPDLPALSSSLGMTYFDPSTTHAGALSFGYASVQGETVPMAVPFVGSYDFLGDGSQLFAGGVAPAVAPVAAAAAAAPIPNKWLCQGTTYEAGCRHLCGPSCKFAQVTSTVRCQDGILWRDTVRTGITNVCCGGHDDKYDACSDKYNCGQGVCKTITIPVPFRAPIVIRITCAELLETCRRAADTWCFGCAVANGYKRTDCFKWALGVGPGTPISFVDTVRIGMCCPRCATNASTYDTSCSCEVGL